MISKALSFDDTLLVPTLSDIRSRLDPDTSTWLGGTKLNVPIISSPMDTVTEATMSIELGRHGAMGIVHRFMSPTSQADELKRVVKSKDPGWHYFAPIVLAVGVGDSGRDRFDSVLSAVGESNIDWIAIDIANGHSVLMREMIEYVKGRCDVPVMAGNVATGEGFAYLAQSGVDAVRVGIGGGRICKTRIMTGFGLPTLESVHRCYQTKIQNDEYSGVAIIADGGIRYPSDMVKSLVAGADAIMGGSIFAGTIETPGEVFNLGAEKVKVYRGMASASVQNDRRGGLKPGTCAEGVSTHVPLNGKAKYVLEEFSGGLRSAMTYAGANNLSELRRFAKFVTVTSAGLEESHAYGTKK